MITLTAKHRLKVLTFWKQYGLKAALAAFGISRRTLYGWQATFVKGNNQPEALNEKPKRPKTVRKRAWPQVVTDQIRQLRDEHPNLGKDKIQVFIAPFCKENKLPCPSVSTIGNLIRDMGGLRKFPVKVRHNGQIVARKRAKVVRKPKQFVADYPGHCGSFDTVERHIYGTRRYIITFTDVYSRFSLAWATNSHASLAAKEFFNLTTFLFPFPLQYVLTDNGSEFMKHFDAELRSLHLTHWHTYPKTPKMNSHCERFNRSIQEEYIDYHEPELLDPNKFNAGLMKHLLWHNTERPHWGLKLQTPTQFINTNFPKECNMYLTNTFNGQATEILLQ
jgi:transposase InsO family protein